MPNRKIDLRPIDFKPGHIDMAHGAGVGVAPTDLHMDGCHARPCGGHRRNALVASPTTCFGGWRVVDWLSGEQLPRSC